MLFTPIHVQTYGKSDTERSKAVLFKGKKSKIDPDQDIPSVKQPLENPSIPVAICLVPATHMMCNLKQPLSSK